jgi:hypothetical protein
VSAAWARARAMSNTLAFLTHIGPITIIPAIAGLALGLRLGTRPSRFLFALTIFLSVAAFIWLLQAEHTEQSRFGQPVLGAIFFSLGLTGRAAIDDWILATIASVVLSVLLGYFVLAIGFAAGGL